MPLAMPELSMAPLGAVLLCTSVADAACSILGYFNKVTKGWDPAFDPTKHVFKYVAPSNAPPWLAAYQEFLVPDAAIPSANVRLVTVRLDATGLPAEPVDVTARGYLVNLLDNCAASN
jgi:hypothetical protein